MGKREISEFELGKKSKKERNLDHSWLSENKGNWKREKSARNGNIFYEAFSTDEIMFNEINLSISVSRYISE